MTKVPEEEPTGRKKGRKAAYLKQTRKTTR